MKIFSRELNEALEKFLLNDDCAIVLGEDVCDPYGGAFSITRGLSTRFPDRVWNSPIAEAGILGFSLGLASEGIPVVMELMFGDFSLLVLDQLHNTVSKVAGMGDMHLPLIIRAPMGGYRGYGPTHSQTLNRFLVGSENIDVVFISNFVSPQTVLERTVQLKNPCFFVEDKQTYAESYMGNIEKFEDLFDINRVGNPFNDVYFVNEIESNADRPLLICFGSSIRLGLQAAKELLIKSEIVIDILQVNSFWPINSEDLSKISCGRKSVVLVEEGWLPYGLAGEFVSRLMEWNNGLVMGRIRRVGAKSSIIPAARAMENSILPSVEDVIAAVTSLVRSE